MRESLYEAVAIAVARFRGDDVGPSNPGPLREFTVAVPPVEHKIRLSQVAKWAEPTTREGPAGLARLERVRTAIERTSEVRLMGVELICGRGYG